MSSNISILLIDDDQTILDLLMEVLGREPGCEACALSSSTQALDLLGRQSFDLVVTDLKMPGVSGMDILDYVRRHYPDTLLVLVTGYGTLETTLDAIRAGVYDYITKPFRIEEFRLLVRNAADRIRLLRETSDLREQNRALSRERDELEKVVQHQSVEIRRLERELGRLDDLLVASGAQPRQVETIASALSAYERNRPNSGRRLPTIEELENRFAAGLLTPDEFEAARQRLKGLS